MDRQRIIVDWGTSSFRAYRFGADGALIDQRKAAAGILTVENAAFEDVMEWEIGAWLEPGAKIFLSGMITSRNGWLETPYIEAPATLEALAQGARSMTARSGANLLFLPGVCVKTAFPDVMRGEEIQVFGSIEPGETATIVLPGTHSKWVKVEKGTLQDFRSFMTGEVFAALKTHTILGRLIPPETPADQEAFISGVKQALSPGSAGLLSDIFSARSGALLGRLEPEQIADHLSGLTIGHELRGGIALGWAKGTIRVVGDAALINRYLVAMEAAGIQAVAGPELAAVEGFKRLGVMAA